MKMKSTLFCLVFALCTNTCITVYAQAVNKQDSLALVDLYNSTNGPNWFSNFNWLTKHPVSTWSGIIVTNRRVTALHLDGNNLSGSIPPSIGNLVNVTFLNLGIDVTVGNVNHLTGNIPSSLGNLVNLGYLNIEYNQLSGSIPSSLGNLLHLQLLLLDNNQLSGSIPSSFGKLTELTGLDLNGNQLSGNIPSSIGNLVNLEALALFNNQLSGSIPSSLGNLVNLKLLGLAYNQLSGSIPSSLGNLVNLAGSDDLIGGLLLNNNLLSGRIPSSLGRLVNLVYLDLSNNQLSDSIPSSIGNLTNLLDLDLSNNQLSGSIPSSIANLVNLGGESEVYIVGLYLDNNRFTFTSMEFIQKTFSFAKYAPQALIPVHQSGNTLWVSAGGKLRHNTYKWFRVTKAGNVVVATIAGDSVFHPSQNGTYTVNVTNSVATQLTLRSNTIKYVAPSQIVASASAFSSENALQQNNKANMFFVNPNPARDILHVQTNGKATLTLTDQSGKILFTKNINGKDEINVANLAAGLYYLRNNETGAVQKVIVNK